MKRAKNLNLAVLANVDAGKTTLAESLLFVTGGIRRSGRVDHGDAFLDTYALEKSRGITIFSKMARLNVGSMAVTLLDTPGHVDFSAETERALQAADAALLVISAADGVTGPTQTLFSLLEDYIIPTVLFVNKMDQDGADREKVSQELREKLSSQVLPLTELDLLVSGKRISCTAPAGERYEDSAVLDYADGILEEIAVADESILDTFLESGAVTLGQLRTLIAERKIFPAFFGSALRMTGIDVLASSIEQLFSLREYPDTFGAKVYKISRDEKGERLTFVKVTGGELRARDILKTGSLQDDAESAGSGEESTDPYFEEKVNQIRIYSGKGYTQAECASAGTVAALTGLVHTYAGEVLGKGGEEFRPVLEPVLSYSVLYPAEEDRLQMYARLKELAEEIPELAPAIEQSTGEIFVRVMGQVQTEVLQTLFQERFGVKISFGEGRIVYRETIRSGAEGVGHFEPLWHYAEVHFLLEPGESGSGITVESACSTDDLSMNWQRLAMSSVKNHRLHGVLTASELTDVKITLLGGKASLKHTSGGDFRQASLRAVRMGLMKSESVLLEPWYEFTLRVPQGQTGRAMKDISDAFGTMEAPEIYGDLTVLRGRAPVATMRSYQAEVRAYTGGRGTLQLRNGGYDVCHNAEEVLAGASYDPDHDIRHPSWSVFCAHGAGFDVPWYEVEDYMHLPLFTERSTADEEEDLQLRAEAEKRSREKAEEAYHSSEAASSELEEIFERTYGRGRWRPQGNEQSDESGPVFSGPGRGYGGTASGPDRPGGGRKGPTGLHPPRKVPEREKYLLVDGYNIIFAWEDLRDLASRDLHAARTHLCDTLSNYQGFRNMNLIVVFDAYRVENGTERVMKWHNIYVVFTREAETADRYIEKTVHRMGRNNDITVATSDNAEQVIIFGGGARRMSACELLEEVTNAAKEIRSDYLDSQVSRKNYLFQNLDKETKEQLLKIRLGDGQGGGK